jgi:hypothetical protein
VFTNLLLLNLIAEEFDTGCWSPEEPLYMEFNGTKYTQFSDKLIIDILENGNLKMHALCVQTRYGMVSLYGLDI